jgi:hypothetical protein
MAKRALMDGNGRVSGPAKTVRPGEIPAARPGAVLWLVYTDSFGGSGIHAKIAVFVKD